MLKKTPLFEEHAGLGGRFTGFGGWDMPVQYTSIIGEHNAVRTRAGVFDTSHMGELVVSGEGAEAFLGLLTTADVPALAPGQAKYAFFLNERGGILDDLIIYKRESDFLLIVNAGNAERDLAWLREHIRPDVSVTDISPRSSLIALQGPAAQSIMQPLVADDLDALGYFRHIAPRFTFMQPAYALLARTGYTGEDGFEILVPNECAVPLWRKIVEAGAQPSGLGCRDTLRLEACMPLHGHEITEETTPLQAGLGWAVSWNGEFIGKEALEAQKASGPGRTLIAFTMDAAGVPRADCGVSFEGRPAGTVTSGTFSPTLKKGIGMAYVDAPLNAGDRIGVTVHGQERPATVVRKPFYRRSR